MTVNVKRTPYEQTSEGAGSENWIVEGVLNRLHGHLMAAVAYGQTEKMCFSENGKGLQLKDL